MKNNYDDSWHILPDDSEKELQELAISIFGNDSVLPWFIADDNTKIWKVSNIHDKTGYCWNIDEMSVSIGDLPESYRLCTTKEKLLFIGNNQLTHIPLEQYLISFNYFFNESKHFSISQNIVSIILNFKTIPLIKTYGDLDELKSRLENLRIE